MGSFFLIIAIRACVRKLYVVHVSLCLGRRALDETVQCRHYCCQPCLWRVTEHGKSVLGCLVSFATYGNIANVSMLCNDDIVK